MVAEGRLERGEKRDQPGDVRRGRPGPVPEVPDVPGIGGAVDVDAGGGDVDTGRSVVREPGQGAIGGRCGDRNDVGGGVARGIARGDVIVGAPAGEREVIIAHAPSPGIAGGRDDEDAGLICELDRILERRAALRRGE